MQRALYLTRGLATQAAAASRLIRPAIPQFGIEGKYTTALYSAASKTNSLDKVENDLKKLKATLETDEKLRNFLKNPLVNVNQKKQALTEALTSKLGACETTVNLVSAMAETRRLNILSKVANSFIRLMQALRGELECTVTTSKPVTDEAIRKEIEASLKGFTKNTLKIKMEVDPSIVGGMIINFGGEYYVDMSIRSKVKMYADLLQQGI